MRALCELVGDRSYAKAAGASRQSACSKECSNEVSGKPGFRRVAQIGPACVGESAFGTTQTSRSRPDMSVHWGEAVKVTPHSK
jgi:hypothetical protein